MNSDVVDFIQIQIFAGISLTNNFQIITTDGFEGPLRYIHIENTCEEPVIISYDNQYGAEYIKANDDIDFYPQECSGPTNNLSVFKKYQKIYVKAFAAIPKGGGVIISGFYQE